MYTIENFKTKKQLLNAFHSGEEIRCFQPGPFGPQADKNGWVAIEGPHYPQPHRFYAQAFLEDGIIKKIK